MIRWLALAATLWSSPAPGCEIALVLGVDVSNSVDAQEYDLQRSGMARALADPEIAAALVAGAAMVAVVQWSGSGEQDLSVPWTALRTPADLVLLQSQVAGLQRAFGKSDTAVGEALAYMAALMPEAGLCKRQVIDFAGDGVNNAGPPPADARAVALAQGIVINGLGIDRVGRSVTQYYRRHVIGGPGAFVLTATGYRDFARAFREKLFRELLKPVA